MDNTLTRLLHQALDEIMVTVGGKNKKRLAFSFFDGFCLLQVAVGVGCEFVRAKQNLQDIENATRLTLANRGISNT
jgi:hypothetical protein